MAGTPGGLVAQDLAELLAKGERAAFHGRPGNAVAALEQAIVLARSQDRRAEVTAAAWLLGVALSAAGRYGGALTLLLPLVDAGASSAAEGRLFGALAAATVASVHRQLGRHAAARGFDERGLAMGEGADEAVFDCRLGLAADAVGLGDLQTALLETDAAAALVPERDDWWRQRVRLEWVRAEVAMLGGQPVEAVAAAATAVERAEAARAPRHVAKGLLFEGVAQVESDDPSAAATLRRAATLAEGLGALPLVWPARAVLGALLGESAPAESARCLSTARSAVLTIASDLPDDLRDEWLARADVAALLGSD